MDSSNSGSSKSSLSKPSNRHLDRLPALQPEPQHKSQPSSSRENFKSSLLPYQKLEGGGNRTPSPYGRSPSPHGWRSSSPFGTPLRAIGEISNSPSNEGAKGSGVNASSRDIRDIAAELDAVAVPIEGASDRQKEAASDHKAPVEASNKSDETLPAEIVGSSVAAVSIEKDSEQEGAALNREASVEAPPAEPRSSEAEFSRGPDVIPSDAGELIAQETVPEGRSIINIYLKQRDASEDIAQSFEKLAEMLKELVGGSQNLRHYVDEAASVTPSREMTVLSRTIQRQFDTMIGGFKDLIAQMESRSESEMEIRDTFRETLVAIKQAITTAAPPVVNLSLPEVRIPAPVIDTKPIVSAIAEQSSLLAKIVDNIDKMRQPAPASTIVSVAAPDLSPVAAVLREEQSANAARMDDLLRDGKKDRDALLGALDAALENVNESRVLMKQMANTLERLYFAHEREPQAIFVPGSGGPFSQENIVQRQGLSEARNGVEWDDAGSYSDSGDFEELSQGSDADISGSSLDSSESNDGVTSQTPSDKTSSDQDAPVPVIPVPAPKSLSAQQLSDLLRGARRTVRIEFKVGYDSAGASRAHAQQPPKTSEGDLVIAARRMKALYKLHKDKADRGDISTIFEYMKTINRNITQEKAISDAIVIAESIASDKESIFHKMNSDGNLLPGLRDEALKILDAKSKIIIVKGATLRVPTSSQPLEDRFTGRKPR